MRGEDDSRLDQRGEQVSKISQLFEPVESSRDSPWSGVAVEVFRLEEPTSVSVSVDDFYVAVIREGVGKAWANGERGSHPLEPGVVGIFPPGVVHGASSRGAIAAASIYLEPALITHAREESVNPDRIEIVPRIAIADPQIDLLAKALESEIHNGFSSGRLFGESLGTALAAHLLARYAVNPAPMREYRGGMSKHLFRRTIDYMQSDLGADLRLADLAANAQMSLWHFCRMFKQSSGLTPHQYLMRERIEAAKRLLNKPHPDLEMIAAQLGFSDQSHFTTVFRRLTGVTPRQYVKAAG
jgi:AraC family transcriptional regulator